MLALLPVLVLHLVLVPHPVLALLPVLAPPPAEHTAWALRPVERTASAAS